MKRSVKKIVRNLPGFQSYCECVKPCSGVEIDHVVPKSLLKKKSKKFNQANNDMHNLFRCCHKINNPKGSKLIGSTYTTDSPLHDSYLARSALYMGDRYDLFTGHIYLPYINRLKYIALSCNPFDFEYDRNIEIESIQGCDNKFVTDYPQSIIKY